LSYSSAAKVFGLDVASALDFGHHRIPFGGRLRSSSSVHLPSRHHKAALEPPGCPHDSTQYPSRLPQRAPSFGRGSHRLSVLGGAVSGSSAGVLESGAGSVRAAAPHPIARTEKRPSARTIAPILDERGDVVEWSVANSSSMWTCCAQVKQSGFSGRRHLNERVGGTTVVARCDDEWFLDDAYYGN